MLCDQDSDNHDVSWTDLKSTHLKVDDEGIHADNAQARLSLPPKRKRPQDHSGSEQVEGWSGDRKIVEKRWPE